MNGIRQNDKAESNVKVTGLSPNISVRIEFEDKALPQIKQNMFLEGGLEHTAKIKRDLKKQVKLRYFGQTPITNSNDGISTVAYHTTENPVQNNNANVNVNTNASGSGNVQNNGNTTITTTTTTTTTKANTGTNGNENVNVNINMGGVGINMNVNGMGAGMDMSGGNMNSTTSTTVTTTSSSSSSSSNSSSTGEQSQGKTNTTQMSNTPVKAACTMAMSQASFDKMKQSVESKPFSETKMSTAKVATKNSCLSVNQVMSICKLFSMDEDKLTYAKFAYDYCVDKANYYQVSEVFSFSATTEEFNKFLEQ